MSYPVHCSLNQDKTAREGDLDGTRKALGEGANVNGETSSLQTPLQRAVRGGHLQLVEILCEKGADVNAQTKFFEATVSFSQLKGRNIILTTG